MTSVCVITSQLVSGSTTAITPTLGSGTGIISGPTTLTTPSVDGTYKALFQVVQLTVGTGGTCSTQGTVQIYLQWKDADQNYGVTGTYNFLMQTLTGNTTSVNMVFAGTINASDSWIGSREGFRAKAGTAIAYSINASAGSNCTTPATFIVRPSLWYLGY